jgi:hypothetical protein
MTGHVLQGMRFDEALKILRRIDVHSLPPEQESPVLLCPETTAALVAFANARRTEPGVYCLVDVGAWTSDISVFRLTDIAAGTGVRTVANYAAGAFRSAAGRIDELAAELCSDIWGRTNWTISTGLEPLVGLQRAREADKPGAIRVRVPGLKGLVDLPDSTVDVARRVVSAEITRAAIDVAMRAARKDLPGAVPGCQMLYMGGGSLDPTVLSALRAVPYKGSMEEVPFLGRNQQLANRVGKPGPDEHLAALLPVAFGLSYPRALWPNGYQPSEVSDYEVRRRYLPTSEERGYDEK